ncbi:MAG: Ig-like domain-containing protein [Thermodesulfobacteriota bacterium]|nr:Ig-like domain-containing protein [Thermodesulfobacteriota bacterium]
MKHLHPLKFCRGGDDPDIPTNVGVVNVSPSAVTLETRGATRKITATAIFIDGPQQVLGADMAGVLWQSSNADIASVDSAGNVTALSNGTADITCTYGYQTGTAIVTVAFPELTGLRLDPAQGATLGYSGAVAYFKVFAVYSKGPEMNVTPAASWSVENGSIASVDSAGTVTALSEGSTGLTASFGGFTVSCNIKVVFPHPALKVSITRVTLSVSRGSDGSAGSFDISNTGTGSMSYTVVKVDDWLSVTPASGTLNKGQTASVTITPSASGMDAGTYSGVITVTAPGAVNAPQYITVNLEVTENTGPFTNSLGMTFKKIPAGTFMTGSPNNEFGHDDDEGPQHQVTLTQDYYMLDFSKFLI